MTQVVQARCPHCQNTLRIPADWLDKAMRCKFCKSTFEARTKSNDTPLPATALSATPLAASTISFPPADAGPATAPRPRKSHKGLLFAGCAVLLVLAIPAVLVGLLILGAFGGGLLLLTQHETTD